MYVVFRYAEQKLVDGAPGGHSWGVSDPVAPVRPEAMRELVREYVRAVHTTYLDHVAHLPPAVRGALPLVAAGGVTVVAAAARRLHLVATTDRLPAPDGPEVDGRGRTPRHRLDGAVLRPVGAAWARRPRG
jgi:hypothetical protein